MHCAVVGVINDLGIYYTCNADERNHFAPRPRSRVCGSIVDCWNIYFWLVLAYISDSAVDNLTLTE